MSDEAESTGEVADAPDVLALLARPTAENLRKLGKLASSAAIRDEEALFANPAFYKALGALFDEVWTTFGLEPSTTDNETLLVFYKWIANLLAMPEFDVNKATLTFTRAVLAGMVGRYPACGVVSKQLIAIVRFQPLPAPRMRDQFDFLERS